MKDQELIKLHLEEIKNRSLNLEKPITLMEICGGHTRIILEYGIRQILPSNIKLISGPGCPVCVCSQYDIDCMIALAANNVPIATYGDMMRVPGSNQSLEEIKAKGGIIHEVYSATEVLELQKEYSDIVFFGIGFETTSPMTAYLLENNICVYSCHKLVPPAMKALILGNLNVDGFILPGHVSTIIGLKQYKEIKFPQAISGFSAEMILRAINILVELIVNNNKEVINAYPEAVHAEGNKTAQDLLKKHFVVSDSLWRGLGMIEQSGLEVINPLLNAKIKYHELLKSVPKPKKTTCRCGEILKGLIEPKDCPLYKTVCTRQNPQGACMVSSEGTCAISFEYGI